MTKPLLTFDRRTLLRSGMAASAAAATLTLSQESQAATQGQAEAAPGNVGGYYRFRVGD